MKTSVLIQNLKCDACGSTITSKVSMLEDVSGVSADMETSIASHGHTFDVTYFEVKRTLVELGIPKVDERNTLSRKAKSYISSAIEKNGY